MREGDEVTPFYDSMIAKLIVWDEDRATALATLRGHLDGLRIEGVVTTAPFHRWLIEQVPVVNGRVTTRFLDETTIPADPTTAAPFAARAWDGGPTGGDSLFEQLGSFRVTPHRPDVPLVLRSIDGELHEAKPSEWAASDSISTEGWSASPRRHDADASAGGAAPHPRICVDSYHRTITVTIDDYPHHFTVPHRSEIWAGEAVSGAAHGDAVTAPFPGTVTEVGVESGQTVTAGETCIVIEAMKMLHTLTAPIDGTVAEVHVSPGDQVTSSQVLVTFESTPSHSEPSTEASSD